VIVTARDVHEVSHTGPLRSASPVIDCQYGERTWSALINRAASSANAAMASVSAWWRPEASRFSPAGGPRAASAFLP